MMDFGCIDMPRPQEDCDADAERASARRTYTAGLADGARGRGSRARYRKQVIDAIERWAHGIHRFCRHTGRPLTMDERTAAYRRHSNAARRARRILQALDAGGSDAV